MQINSIKNFAVDATRKVGKTLVENRPDSAKLKKGMLAVNKFVQGEGINPGRGAYYALMTGCVIAPRLVEAREPDEFREILTRDVTSVAVILFAMKGLKSAMCMAAQKSGGLVLVKDMIDKNASKMKRLGGYLNPEGGIIALNSEEIMARYSRFADKNSLVKTLKTVDKEGGNVAKMFNIENNESAFEKIGKIFKSKKNNEKSSKPLFEAAKKMFGEDFIEKSNDELISIIENIKPEYRNSANSLQKEAFEGLEAVIGTKAALGEGGNKILKAEAKSLGTDMEKYSKQLKQGILNNKNNPLTWHARVTSAIFETISLAITAGFLGFGLPAINEALTTKKHLNMPGTSTKRSYEANPDYSNKNAQLYKAIKAETGNTFHSFM